MGLFSKAKEAMDSALGSVMSVAGDVKGKYDQMKSEKAAYNEEMNAKAKAKAQEIVDAIENYQNDSVAFEGIEKPELLAFTKDFYDRIVMPANSITQSCVSMYPYITEKQLKKFCNGRTDFDSSETPLVYLRAAGKQEIMITESTLYFSVALEDNSKYFAKGKVPCHEISKFSFEIGENTSLFKCDDYVLASFFSGKVTREDFITLNNYFERIANHRFTISDEEVDQLIKDKIGDKITAEVKKYMVYDDELMVYFAWGLDSLSAKDYIVCTNRQIIIMDREMFGATLNVKQFYYEDITSATTEQNSNSDDLSGFLLDTLVTAATKTCNLIISVAGATHKIDTLCKVEAERVVAVYHQYRKALKQASAQPQVVVQQAVDPIEQIKKLKELLDMGIITQEEFDAKKKSLLNL